jgi:magnesium transporter
MAYDVTHLSEERFEGTIPIEKLVREPNQVLWLDVVGLGSIDAVKSLAKTFELHALALEDALHQRQHPKTETYGDTVFMVMRLPHVREDATAFEQVSLFLGPDFVVTFQEEEADCFDSIRDRIRGARGRIRHDGADYLAYALLDAAIDQYLPLADSIGDRIDQMEREILSTPDGNAVERLLDLRGDISQLRRNVAPSRDAIAAMDSIAGTLVSDNTKLYLRDCQDHLVQLQDLVEGYHDAIFTLVSLHLSVSSQRMNEAMRVLTVFAALFMPLSFMAGVYGMNFDPDASPYNMPELGWGWGYPAVLVAMLLVAGGMFVFFRRRGWLGAIEEAPHE